jgi:sarcosine oxidase, subunit beta
MTGAESADVVVVGAGALGASVAHHLLERGAGRVLVLDAGQPGSATSGAGAGFVAPWSAGYVAAFGATELELQLYGIDFYQRLAVRHPDIDCRTNGSMFVATTADGMAEWIEPVLGHALAPPGTRPLTPAEVAAVTDGVVPAGSVLGGALHPGGLQISAGRAARALTCEVEAAGGELRADTRVLGLLTAGRRVVGVRTDGGDIAASRVVLACGAWTNDILAEVGYSLPLLRMVVTRAVSPPSGVPGTMPTVMVPELQGLWVREHRGGLTWGNGDGTGPDTTAHTRREEAQPHREEIATRMQEVLSPALHALIPAHDTSVGRWLQGLPCYTPDRLFVAGAVPGVDGLFVLGGDNGAGVTHGPGLGRLLAETITDGDGSWVDGSPYRPDRFASGAFPDAAAVTSVAASAPVRH